MSYTMAQVSANGYTVELCASGNKRYIVLERKESGTVEGKLFISEHMERSKGEDLFWKVSRLVAELMYSWGDWVEMLEA